MKKTSIKTLIAVCFVGMLIISNLIMLLINQGSIRRFFREQVYDDMGVILEQTALHVESELESVEKSLNELSRNSMLTNDTIPWADKVAFFEKRAEELGFTLFFILMLRECAKILPQVQIALMFQIMNISNRQYREGYILQRLELMHLMVQK